jgi:hypothetical protein
MSRAARTSRQEGHHASTTNRPYPPPRPTGPPRPLQVRQLWRALTADHRHRILHALGRLVAEHLRRPPLPREVTHERP